MKNIYVTVTVIAFLVFLPFIGFGDTIILKNGSQFESNIVWTEGDQVKCEYHGDIAVFPKEDIKEIVQNKEQENILKNPKFLYYGDFKKAEKQYKEGSTTLTVWTPYVKYMRYVQNKYLSNAIKPFLRGVNELTVKYDEKWIWINDRHLDQLQKKAYQSTLDRNIWYWKNKKIQACVLEEYFESNPLTNEKLLTPEHKITSIYDREYILKDLGIQP
jgi:hypothetical protein